MARYTKKRGRGTAPLRRVSLKAKTTSNRPAKCMQCTREQMDAAIRAVESGSAVSINRAAKGRGIPPTTLKDRLSSCVVDGTKAGCPPYLNNEEESELESYLIQSSQVGYGKTRRQIKAIVENMAVVRGNLRKSHISDGWWKKFLEWHPKLSLRSGDGTGHVCMNTMTRNSLLRSFERGSLMDSFEPAIPSSVSSPTSSESPPSSSSAAMSQSGSSSMSTSSSQSSSSPSTPNSSSPSSSPLASETPPDNAFPVLLSSPEAPVPETPPTKSVSSAPPPNALSQERSPLAPIVNRSLAVTPLSYVSTISKPEPKSKGKTGHVRVLTSPECVQMLEEKERKKEKEAKEKEVRKKEWERRKIEKEQLQKKKARQKKKQEDGMKKHSVTGATVKMVKSG